MSAVLNYPAARPAPALRRFLTDNNPFYLLSAACMLTGIFTLNDSLDWSPLPIDNLMVLIVTLNVYELLLVGLAAMLLRRGIVRDAMWVLIIEALFMADGGFLNMEIFTADVGLGFAVNFVVAVLCAAKLFVVFRAAGLAVPSGLYAFAVAQLVMLFTVPGVFAQIAASHGGWVPAPVLYAMWWTLAVLPVMYVVLAGGFDIFTRGETARAQSARLIARMFILLPMISLIAHLSLSHWVHKVPFHLAHLSPLLLGLTYAIGRADRRFATLTHRMEMQLGFPALAILLALGNFSSVQFDLGPISIAPLRLTLLASMLTYLDGFAVHRHWLFLSGAVACFGGACMGSTPDGMFRNSVNLSDWFRDRLKFLFPRTPSQWGVLSVVSAFVLLGLGALVSLKRVPVESREGS